MKLFLVVKPASIDSDKRYYTPHPTLGPPSDPPSWERDPSFVFNSLQAATNIAAQYTNAVVEEYGCARSCTYRCTWTPEHTE